MMMIILNSPTTLMTVDRCRYCTVWQRDGVERGGAKSAARCHVAVRSTFSQSPPDRLPIYLRHHQHVTGVYKPTFTSKKSYVERVIYKL